MDIKSSKAEPVYTVWTPNSLYDSRPTDLHLVVEFWKFHVHKDVLSKSSDYFSAMFSSQMIESVQSVISLQLVSPEPFKILLEGIYSGSLDLTIDNVLDVAQAAQMIQIRTPLQTKCAEFMKNNLMDLEHCLELMYSCITLNLPELYCESRRFCLAHFTEIRQTSSFESLTLAELYDYLSDKYLVVENEVHVVETIHKWFSTNKNYIPAGTQEYDNIQTQVKKIISSCVCVKDNLTAHDTVAEAVLCDELLAVDKFQFALSKRARQEDVFMFWTLLTGTDSNGLVDLVKLTLDTGNGVKFDTMTDIVENPGFQLGSALCSLGPYVYLSGGGPSFGKANWIRQIWRFDVSKESKRWEVIGDLIEFRRSHAMVATENKLYIFGGFGKFRTKNSRLDSFDILTGTWEQLPPMPAHELNPLAAVSDDKIFYMCSDWKAYFFSTVTNSWSELNLLEIPTHRPLSQAQPSALFPVRAHNTNCLAVVAITDICLQIPLLCPNGKDLILLKNDNDIASISNIFTYSGSALVNGKVVMFLTSEKIDEAVSGESETSILQKVLAFDPSSNSFCEMPSIRNVRKTQSIVALPHLPNKFTMGLVDLQ